MTNKYIDLSEDSLNLYLKDVRKNEIITIDEEVELAKRIKNGDEVALNKLVTSNLRFVIKIAKEYQNKGLPVSDLISEGNYGLITAAKRFDHTKGFRFISYAIWWIKQSILQSLNDNSRTVRLPGNIINKLSKIKKQIEFFEKENHRGPYNDEVEQISIPTCTSYNVFINEDGDEMINLLEDKSFNSPDIFEDEEQYLKVREMSKAIRGLSSREIDIVNCYYGINGESMTLEMIGNEVGLTKERVRQIKEGAIRKIRNNIGGVFNI
jgi:RNA polymerase primary sigma factor